jgi:hypothetical protein
MNVRWDEVVTCARVQPAVASDVPRKLDGSGRDGDAHVHVTLFGALASQATDQSFDLVLRASATIGDVVAVLGDSLGEEFLARVLDETQRKHRYCRLYVAGRAVEDLHTPLNADSTNIEMIMLIAPEGG